MKFELLNLKTGELKRLSVNQICKGIQKKVGGGLFEPYLKKNWEFALGLYTSYVVVRRDDGWVTGSKKGGLK